MSKKFLAFLAAIIVGLVLLFAFTDSNSSNSGGNSSGASPTNHIRGGGGKGITLVEYGDYQCPVCEAYEPVIQQVVNQFSEDIFFQFRNLPLSQIHPSAFAAARAAEAADKQSKFWEMHDMLYNPTNWQAWTQTNNGQTFFEGYATQLGLDLNKFKQDYASSEVNNIINADLAQFPKDFKATTGSYDSNKDMSTPTFFLDGKHIENSSLTVDNIPDLEKFTQVINDAIKAKSQ